jgi:hypothetical protein
MMLLHRRKFLLEGTAGLALAAMTSCEAEDTTKTVQDIIDTIKKTCSFTTTAQALIPIILTVVSTLNASAGAAATVAASVATQVADMVCAAVKKQVAQNKASLKKAAPSGDNLITVIVNGKEVVGEYTGG